VPKKTLELDMNRMNRLATALRALDGREAIAGKGDAARVVMLPFKLGPLRHVIAKNLGVLRPHLEAFNEARNGVLREVSGGLRAIDGEKEPEKFARFSEQVDKMATEKASVELETIPLPQLHLDVNEIPPDAIEALSELLESAI
jgi:hypothetical protein